MKWRRQWAEGGTGPIPAVVTPPRHVACTTDRRRDICKEDICSRLRGDDVPMTGLGGSRETDSLPTVLQLIHLKFLDLKQEQQLTLRLVFVLISSSPDSFFSALICKAVEKTVKESELNHNERPVSIVP